MFKNESHPDYPDLRDMNMLEVLLQRITNEWVSLEFTYKKYKAQVTLELGDLKYSELSRVLNDSGGGYYNE